MIRMLSSFDLRPGEDFTSFMQDYHMVLADLRSADMIVDAGPLGRRVAHTPMDTDAERTQEYYCVMCFRDRDQLDAAYAHIDARTRPGTASHLKMYRRLTNTVFLCWEDCDLEKE
ncbi:MAG: hypothetical protein AB8B62_04065 [Roseobacter sp.]